MDAAATTSHNPTFAAVAIVTAYDLLVSNLEEDPPEVTAIATTGSVILEPRDVPLGGPRAMTVRRTLPQRRRSLIGPWCFVDHYGPDPVATVGGMHVPPHPHTGLQTVSWLFHGEIEHRDSVGSHAMVSAGRTQPHDRGSRDPALRNLDALDHRVARRAAVGRAARCVAQRRTVLRTPRASAR